MHKHIHALKRRAMEVKWKPLLLKVAGGLVVLLVVVQLFYPSDRLLPFVTVDKQSVGMRTKQEAIKLLNEAYQSHKLAIYMGIDATPFSTPTLKATDITVDNTARITAMSYPWYMRIIPTSLFWAGLKKTDAPAPIFGKGFEQYVDKTLMAECRKAPVDATLRADGEKLVSVAAQPGGQCERADVVATLKKVRPNLTSQLKVKVAQKAIAPAVGDNVAKQLADEISERIKAGIPLQVSGATVQVPAKDVVAWLDFASKDGAIAVAVNADRSATYLNGTIAPKVAVKPGVSYITTVDFTETSRSNGSNGQALDLGATANSIRAFVVGDANGAQAATKVLPPTEQYTRSYSPTDAGLSALLANYAKDHSGTFGITLIEMDGKKRRADYNGDKKFVTASTYKLFAAYSLLKRIDAGTKSWDSNADCFNKMISLSDNACAEAFLSELGLRNITNDINAIGLKNSNFIENGGPFTTSNDLALLLGMLQSGQNFSPTNRDRLIGAMKNNVFRKGIPSGASGTVADKVGFMNGLLHDAAIVYSPSGTYILVVMTDGSSWATIADLAKQIDSLRAH
jgi:beta-lactamase class A